MKVLNAMTKEEIIGEEAPNINSDVTPVPRRSKAPNINSDVTPVPRRSTRIRKAVDRYGAVAYN